MEVRQRLKGNEENLEQEFAIPSKEVTDVKLEGVKVVEVEEDASATKMSVKY